MWQRKGEEGREEGKKEFYSFVMVLLDNSVIDRVYWISTALIIHGPKVQIDCTAYLFLVCTA